MKIKKENINQRTLQEILDSDDELAVDFDDSPCTPAYQDDTRFEYYRQINDKQQPTNNKSEKETATIEKEEVKLGIFNKKDALCLQYIQRESNDTVAWFFEFLIQKNLQSNYKFLNSCLVPKYEQYYSKSICETVKVYKLNAYYNIVINK